MDYLASIVSSKELLPLKVIFSIGKDYHRINVPSVGQKIWEIWLVGLHFEADLI